MRKPTMSVSMRTKVTPSAATMVRSRCDKRSHLSRKACILSLNVMARPPSRTRGDDGEIELLELARLLAGRIVARRRRRDRRDLAGLDRLEAVDLLELADQIVELRGGLERALHIGLFRLYF